MVRKIKKNRQSPLMTICNHPIPGGVILDTRKFVLRQTGLLAIGQVLCVAATIGIFALLGKYDPSVLLGGIVGGVLSVINFLFMAIGAMLAADKAVEQNVKGGHATIKMSYFLRLVVLAVILFAFAKSGLCNVLAMVLPLAYVRPILTILEFFRKPGDSQK